MLLPQKIGGEHAKLTKRFIDALEPMAGAPLMFDEETPRFAVRVMPSGIKCYVIQYRAEGRTRRHTFGKVGLLTSDEARDQARQLLAGVDRGEDPSQVRQDRRKAVTVDVLCERFFTEHALARRNRRRGMSIAGLSTSSSNRRWAR